MGDTRSPLAGTADGGRHQLCWQCLPQATTAVIWDCGSVAESPRCRAPQALASGPPLCSPTNPQKVMQGGPSLAPLFWLPASQLSSAQQLTLAALSNSHQQPSATHLSSAQQLTSAVLSKSPQQCSATHLSSPQGLQELGGVACTDAPKPVAVAGVHGAVDQHIASILHPQGPELRRLCMSFEKPAHRSLTSSQASPAHLQHCCISAAAGLWAACVAPRVRPWERRWGWRLCLG